MTPGRNPGSGQKARHGQSVAAAAKPDKDPSSVDLEIKRTELSIKQQELAKSNWGNPLVVALFAAALAGIGNAAVAIINGTQQVALEDRKSEQNRILEMLKTGDADKAAANLAFLLDAGLIENANYKTHLRAFLDKRKPGQGPALSAASTISGDRVARYWNDPKIPVCWENPSPADENYRSMVKDAVAASWEANSNLRFLGWAKCAESSKGLRLLIADQPPNTRGLGKVLDGMPNGVVLNFKFDDWNQACKQTVDKCVIATAVHVFGHAIGFAHTQNRSDAPEECRRLAQGETDTTMIGPYDPNSVMNYCNPVWLNDGKLSPLDIAALRTIYGAPEAPPSNSARRPQ
jgi:hypothetical protein